MNLSGLTSNRISHLLCHKDPNKVTVLLFELIYILISRKSSLESSLRHIKIRCCPLGKETDSKQENRPHVGSHVGSNTRTVPMLESAKEAQDVLIGDHHHQKHQQSKAYQVNHVLFSRVNGPAPHTFQTKEHQMAAV